MTYSKEHCHHDSRLLTAVMKHGLMSAYKYETYCCSLRTVNMTVASSIVRSQLLAFKHKRFHRQCMLCYPKQMHHLCIVRR